MGAKLLVIDDDETMREYIKQALLLYGYDAIEAASAEEGLLFARQHNPAMILCDVQMNGMDGYDTLRAFRADPILAGTPFIMVTASSDVSSMREGMGLGADDFLPKPFTPKDLVKAVETQFSKMEVRKAEAETKLQKLRSNINLALPHELLTPLNGILGYAELIKDIGPGLPADELVGMAEHILSGGHRLHRLIQNYLIYAQIEMTSTDPSEIALLRSARTDNVAGALRTYAEGIANQMGRLEDLRTLLHDGLVHIAQEHLIKIVSEVLTNALTFSAPGSPIELRTDLAGDGMIISVSDEGSGMTATEIASVGAFTQFNRQRQEQQGIGLGLTIAKRLTELHGGSFEIAKHAGRTGLKVTIQIPAEVCQPFVREAVEALY